MAHRHSNKRRRRETHLRVWRTRLVFWVGALLAGLVVSGLAIGSVYVDHFFRSIVSENPYLPFLSLPLGMVLITWLLRWLPGAQGSGIPQAIAALHVKQEAVRSRLLSIKIASGKVVLVLIGLACGASIGREGPSVHIGASIVYSMRRFARFPHHGVGRGLILAGSAAGIAAAFNTPLAGVVFAIEEMSRSFENRTASTVLTAVIIAGMTALALQGNYTYFGLLAVDIELGTALKAVLICGIVGGALGGLFSLVLVKGGGFLAPVYRTHPLKLAAICGLVVAVVGLASGGTIYGTGYDEARSLLAGENTVGEGFAMWKIMATLASYWSGIPGGIFAPSLSVGAGVGVQLAQFIPEATVTAIALLGMAAYFTGVVQTPLTAVVIIMEMTHGQTMLLPLMATALLADAVSKQICKMPVYEALAQNFLHGPGSITNENNTEPTRKEK